MTYSVMVLGLLVIDLFVCAVSIFATVKVITKAGYSGWFVLLALVPLVNFVMFLVFAFSKWPVEQRLEAAERANRAGPGSPGGWAPAGGGWGPSTRGPSENRGPRSWDYLSQS